MIFKEACGDETLESMLEKAKAKKKGEDFDLSSVKFLELLIHLRTILIQDSVILRQEFPDLLLLSHEVCAN